MHKGKGKGFWGRTLHMDLSSGQHSWRELDESHYQKWLAGIGLSAETLWSQMPPGADALGPKNILGFTPGLLTDTGALFAGRFTVAGKSPASDTWADANCGGYFSPALKRCTIDGLFLSGSSSTPIYILLTEQGPEILDASDLWGLDTLKTDSVLKNRHGNKAQVACIGPAGEKKSFMAGIFTDKGRSAARGGLGAVMGAKGVKA
ncbi:MAG: aldehyde ferredoxin oxidoreductase, partial [Deltaproteobacteria bacterium]